MFDLYLKHKDESVSMCGGIDRERVYNIAATDRSDVDGGDMVVLSFIDTFGSVV